MNRFQTRTVLILSILSLTAGGCASAPSESGRSHDRTLIAVSNLRHPPFSSRNAAGEVEGLEIDLVAEAAEAEGYDVEWREHDFRDLLRLVAEGRADVAAATLGITEERAALVAFTRPYFETAIVALVRTGADEPATLADLRGRVLGAEQGTTAYPAALDLGAAELVPNVDPGSDWGRMLRDGRIDAMIIDETDHGRLQALAGVRLAVVPEKVEAERFAIAVRHGETSLLKALNAAIERRGGARKRHESSATGRSERGGKAAKESG